MLNLHIPVPNVLYSFHMKHAALGVDSKDVVQVAPNNAIGQGHVVDSVQVNGLHRHHRNVMVCGQQHPGLVRVFREPRRGVVDVSDEDDDSGRSLSGVTRVSAVMNLHREVENGRCLVVQRGQGLDGSCVGVDCEILTRLRLNDLVLQ